MNIKVMLKYKQNTKLLTHRTKHLFSTHAKDVQFITCSCLFFKTIKIIRTVIHHLYFFKVYWYTPCFFFSAIFTLAEKTWGVPIYLKDVKMAEKHDN